MPKDAYYIVMEAPDDTLYHSYMIRRSSLMRSELRRSRCVQFFNEKIQF